ncbi:MAG: site-2 protease family protein [Desulfurococcaceae archaeon]|nr:site-2 protease family protein [Desulfurococcaceae archaeon]
MVYWGFEIGDRYRELRDFFLSIAVLGIAFSWRYLIDKLYSYALAVFIAIGIGFLFHELAHRFTARRFGAYSRYRAWYLGLLLALVISIASRGSVVSAAPGDVEVYLPWYSPRADLFISLAGPLANIVIALISTAIYTYTRIDYIYIVGYINTILAFFNLLPIPPLDGYKAIRRNIFLWLVSFLISLALILHYIYH